MKSCPFCGWKKVRVLKALANDGKFVIGWSAVCGPDYKPCGAEGPIRDTKAAATKAWNKRDPA